MTKTDLFDLYQKLISLVNTAQGGLIRPQVNFENWMATINTELFRDLFSNYEKCQQLNDEYKLPFLKTLNVVVTPVAGVPYDVIPYPANYEYLSSVRFLMRKSGVFCPAANCNFLKTESDGKSKTIEWLDDDVKELRALAEGQESTETPIQPIDNQKFGAALKHLTKSPTLENPIITQFDGGFKIAPKGIGIIVMDYLRTPTRPVFAYSVGPSDTVIYNLGASTQMDWSGIVENEILSRASMKYGLYTREQQIIEGAKTEYSLAHK